MPWNLDKRRKISKKLISKIRELRKKGWSQRDIGNKYNISRHGVRYWQDKETHKYILALSRIHSERWRKNHDFRKYRQHVRNCFQRKLLLQPKTHLWYTEYQKKYQEKIFFTKKTKKAEKNHRRAKQ